LLDALRQLAKSQVSALDELAEEELGVATQGETRDQAEVRGLVADERGIEKLRLLGQKAVQGR